MRRTRIVLYGVVILAFAAAGAEADVDFVKQVQPILQKRCYECHAAETHEAGLRLDQRRDALAGSDSGKVILPGDPEGSLLIKLVSGSDPDRVMPPDGERLSAEQVAILRQWIKEGAKWPEGVDPVDEPPEHWAFRPLRHPQVPEVGHSRLARNEIDRFVFARLEERGIEPSPEADRYTLIRRLSYDLLGLPPEPELVEHFIADNSPDAYERLVDELLDSPHFGERWGRHWLDKARYADSDGYEKDRPRYNAWKYRDWVIRAINDDMPFDQFTIEQLAGDLLESPSDSQLLATAFNRQTLTNTEGGTDQEEFRVAAVMDRIETLGTVWLGLTVGCARCHSHKYDPISQREYYQLFAFFNNGDEANTTVATSRDAMQEYLPKKAEYDRKLAELTRPLEAARKRLRPEFEAWEKTTRARLQALARTRQEILNLSSFEARSENGATLTRLDDGSVLASGRRPDKDVYVIEGTLTTSATELPLTALRLSALTDPSLPANGPGWADNGNFVLSEITLDLVEGDSSRRLEFARAEADFSQKGFDVAQAIDGRENAKGWAIGPETGKSHQATFTLAEPVSVDRTLRLKVRLSQQYEKGDLYPHPLGRFRLQALFGEGPDALGLPEEVEKILTLDADAVSDEQREQLFEYFAGQDGTVKKLRAAVEAHRKTEPFKPEMTVRILQQRTKDPRTTHVLRRGNFLEPLGEVEPGTLRVLPPLSVSDSVSRLDLAKWLVSPENPLTPRVVVNHAWAHLFGYGLVRTLNDFGIRGEAPTHPELLDWLAGEFIRGGWSRKRLIKTIVLSHTYRQTSVHRPELAEVDPENRLLYRQNRVRVEAEIVRDLYLAASGLLDRRIGGPSVFPELPPGIAELSYANNFKWGASDWNNRPDKPHGIAPRDDKYRRGMYTFFKRTAAHPTLVTFDCPDSNTTCVQRTVSNTPLQALTTLNNVVFVEASRALARRVLGRESDDIARLDELFRICLTRPPTSDELRELHALLADSRRYYARHPAAAKEMAGANAEAAVEAAAWTSVARIVLNLDEFITRE